MDYPHFSGESSSLEDLAVWSSRFPSHFETTRQGPILKRLKKSATSNSYQYNQMEEDASVKLARHRFKNVLRHMALQDEEERFLHVDEGESNPDDDCKPVTRYSKKRSKADCEEETPQPSGSCVMKLFDRGVDLGQFEDSTPLYPIARAWMQNKPNDPQLKEEKDDEDYETEIHGPNVSEELEQLPPPEPLPLDEFGNEISVRVPPPLARENEPFGINYGGDMAPSPAVLFQNHLDRWNRVRQRWREAAAANERRYDASIDILQEIHDRRQERNHLQVVATSL